MALLYSSASVLGSKAPDFKNLPAVNQSPASLSDFKDCKALLVVFMCNHCPYVVAVQDRLNALAKRFKSQGLGMIGINANDPVRYPDDRFEKMVERANEIGYQFTYAQDVTQKVAHDYDAVCTPDPYLYEIVNGEFLLRYRGRIDDQWKDERAVTQKDLENAINSLISGVSVNSDQKPSMGCSIKWKV